MRTRRGQVPVIAARSTSRPNPRVADHGRALLAAAVVLAMAGIAVSSTNIRLWVFLAIPATAAVTMPERYLLRRWLHRSRQEGRCLLPVLAAGSAATVRDLITRTRKSPHLGWRVDAVCTADGTG